MGTRLAERRQTVRMSAAYPVVLCDRRGRRIARGRTVSVSESGVFLVAEGRRDLAGWEKLRLAITLPGASKRAAERESTRVVHYLCRVVHTRTVGQFVGLGIKFVQKLQ